MSEKRISALRVPLAVTMVDRLSFKQLSLLAGREQISPTFKRLHHCNVSGDFSPNHVAAVGLPQWQRRRDGHSHNRPTEPRASSFELVDLVSGTLANALKQDRSFCALRRACGRAVVLAEFCSLCFGLSVILESRCLRVARPRTRLDHTQKDHPQLEGLRRHLPCFRVSFDPIEVILHRPFHSSEVICGLHTGLWQTSLLLLRGRPSEWYSTSLQPAHSGA